MRIATTLVAALLGVIGLTHEAEAANPGAEALEEFKEGRGRPGAVENRFFVKQDRFEIAPMVGYVPNNPFAKRYVGGVLLAYHFSEQLAAEGALNYSPDLGVRDLKGLTYTLVSIAQTGQGSTEFAQPLDKVTLAASFAARWAPLYGKINLVGETVLNFDVYGIAGLGMISKVDYYATYPENDPNAEIVITQEGNEVKPTPVLGAGVNFFVNQTIALKLDARSALFVDNVPDYCRGGDDVCDNSNDDAQRLYNNFVASAGLSFYFPKMKPRLYNF